MPRGFILSFNDKSVTAVLMHEQSILGVVTVRLTISLSDSGFDFSAARSGEGIEVVPTTVEP